VNPSLKNRKFKNCLRGAHPRVYSITYLPICTKFQNQTSVIKVAVDRSHTHTIIAFYQYILGPSDALAYDSHIIILNPVRVQV